MSNLLIKEDNLVANWVYTKYRLYPLPINKAVGILNNKNSLVGAILFQNFNGVNLELSYYGPQTLTLGIIRYIAETAVKDFNVARLTVVTSQINRHLIRSLMKIGFNIEGTQKCFYGHEDSKRNKAVRLVVFRTKLNQVAKIETK